MFARIVCLFLFWALSPVYAGPNLNANESIPETETLDQGPWMELNLGVVASSSVELLQSAIYKATSEKYSGLIIILDSPGGALDATRAMVKAILSATIPIIAWVGPSGAVAGSASSFLILASHIAAMAPGTQLGAMGPGFAVDGDQDGAQPDLPANVDSESAALIDSIASLRNRNKEMMQSFIVNSLSVTAQEAVDNKLVDHIAPNVSSLLLTLDGREIKLSPDKSVSLNTAKASSVQFHKSWRQEFLEILSNPSLFYLLILVGLLGLAFEFTHPGVIAPGVIGGISLILGLIASTTLPVNFGALLLLIASIGFIVAELFVPSFGALGIGGLIGFVSGSILLFDDKNQMGLELSLWTILPAAVAIACFAATLSWFILRNRQSRIQSGIESLLGLQVEAVEYFVDGYGRVRMQGEFWNGVEISQQAVKPGDQLLVEAIDGLTLKLKLLSFQNRG